MEKSIKLTWQEVLKWLTFIALLVSSFVANQLDIAYLKKENKRQDDEINVIKEEQKEAGKQAAEMNQKLTQIYDDTQLIKSVLIPDGIHSNHR